MYLSRFGLSEPPFSIAPSAEFFFSGAGRGEMLEALAYAAMHGDGIIKVTSEVGSGKTMLCRMLMARLPQSVETVYLPNPAISREEVIYAVADELGLDCGNRRPSAVLRQVQQDLVGKYAKGRIVLVLIDEAHAMPCESLEELRLLYNLESDRRKLLRIVLFGQKELDGKLDLPRMRQLKDRIVHHFSVKPMTRAATGEYLEFRMKVAGFSGEKPFCMGAVSAIYRESGGLMRRINILADKALLAAYVEGSGRVEARHARAAIRDSGHEPHSGGIFTVLFTLLMLGMPVATSEPRIAAGHDLVEERLRVSMMVLTRHPAYTIRLMEIGRDRKAWLYRFLGQAGSAIDVNSVYVYPAKVDRYLVVYGAYPSRREAGKALGKLPEAYRKTYRPVVRNFPRIAYS